MNIRQPGIERCLASVAADDHARNLGADFGEDRTRCPGGVTGATIGLEIREGEASSVHKKRDASAAAAAGVTGVRPPAISRDQAVTRQRARGDP